MPLCLRRPLRWPSEIRPKYWEQPILDKLARGNRELLERFLIGGLRSESEIIAAEEELFTAYGMSGTWSG